MIQSRIAAVTLSILILFTAPGLVLAAEADQRESQPPAGSIARSSVVATAPTPLSESEMQRYGQLTQSAKAAGLLEAKGGDDKDALAILGGVFLVVVLLAAIAS